MSYDYQGNLIDSGYYKADKRIGVWNAYVFKGRRLVDLQYDYTNKKLLIFHPAKADSGSFNIITSTGVTETQLDRAPVLLDGTALKSRVLMTNIRYPTAAAVANVSGTVVIAFVIDAEGNVSNYRVKKSVGFGCDEVAMAAVKNIRGEWLPGIYKGNLVAVEYSIPISFTLAP